MEELLKTLYRNLYTPCENQETEQELDDCHKQLIDVLGKPERKLVLRIIDGKDRLADEIGLDSFIFGFKLATQLAHELKKYDRPFCTNMANAGMDIKSLQYLMGHSDAGITMNVYTHASYDRAEASLQKILQFQPKGLEQKSG